MSQPCATPSDVVERFLRTGGIAPPLVDDLHGAHARLVAEPGAGPAGWHGPDDIKTLEGLGGNYLWLESLPQIARIGLRFDPAHVGSQGSYEIISGLSTMEQGTFYCVPNNPAIGWAGIVLYPGSPSTPRAFVVAGMFTDRHWKVEMLLLNKLDSSGLVQPPFAATRIP